MLRNMSPVVINFCGSTVSDSRVVKIKNLGVAIDRHLNSVAAMLQLYQIWYISTFSGTLVHFGQIWYILWLFNHSFFFCICSFFVMKHRYYI